MSEGWSPADMCAILSLGLGGPMLGLARRARGPAAGAVAGALGVVAAAAAAAGLPILAWASPAALAASYLGAVVLARAAAADRSRVIGQQHAAFCLAGGPLLAFALVLRVAIASPDDGSIPSGDSETSRLTSNDAPPEGGYSTDLGRLIPRGVSVLPLPPPDEILQYEREAVRRFPDAVIVAPPSNEYNCHGWVFGSGRSRIDNFHVEDILRDNGYARVKEPSDGDLIVYRDKTGVACHTGVVRLDPNGATRVESKWGGMHRYRHPPAQQPFSDQWEFYRSSRSGHLLNIHGAAAALQASASQ